MLRNNIIVLLFVFFSSIILSSFDIKDKFLGATFGCAIGDAMGRPTEFMSMAEIDKVYPKGIKSFSDFREQDLFLDKSGKKFAPYTDDTAMAKLVMKALVEAKKKGLNLEKTMSTIAVLFINDMHEKNGWYEWHRSPGNSCSAGVKILEKRNLQKLKPRWWDVKQSKAGGCGSVMRAFPFGLIFSDDVEKAEKWAVEHSKLTHGSSTALAACAAMAVGTAYSVQNKDVNFVVRKMIEAARRYDESTASMIEDAAKIAEENLYILANRGVACVERARDMSKPVFEKYLGWAAHDAIAAATYAYIVGQNSVKTAIYLGVHTPGDSDSIACMAGALAGAKCGVKNIPTKWLEVIEGSEELERLADEGSKLTSTLPN